MTPPVDAKVRNDATGALNRSLALSAGAGSGKTSVLTARIVALVASGMDVSRIAAMTFTEKAAGEIQTRVREALEKRLDETGDATIRAALDRLHELPLTTIHAFAGRLLELEPVASRWAPRTELLKEPNVGIAEALSAFRRALRDADPRLVVLVEARADNSLSVALLRLLQSRDLTIARATSPFDWAVAHDELARLHHDLEAAARTCRAPATCKALSGNEAFRAALGGWVREPGDGTLRALASDLAGKASGGKGADWPGGSLATFKGVLADFDAWRARHLERAHGVAVSLLSSAAVPVVLDARRAAALASFDDMLFRAADLVQKSEVRARLAARYDAILIDEVQDTDPIQAQIAGLLARDPARHGPWDSHPPREGALFAVGDPKQSIYRFRRADVGVWSRLRKMITSGAGGGSEELVQNFRSVPGLIAWVARVFHSMPDFQRQHAHRKACKLDPVVVLDVSDGGEKATPEREADLLARHLYQLKRSGAQVVDRETNELRPMDWGDVMVLVPRWANADLLAARLLAAEVPCVVEGGGAFFSDPAIKACVAALRALAEPSDEQAAVDALLGVFGLTLDELAAHRDADGTFRCTVPTQPPGPVADALATLNTIKRTLERSWVPVLDRLLDTTRAAAVWSLRAGGARHLANLDKLRAMLRELEVEYDAPSAVIEALRDREYEDDEGDLSRLDPEVATVRVTTIFGAKGLEAPVVALFDMFRKTESPNPVIDRERDVLHLKIGGFTPPGWEATLANEKLALQDERRRWMYVACTRARDQLVVVTHPGATLVEQFLGDGWDRATFAHGALQQPDDGVSIRCLVGDDLPPAPQVEETFPGRDAVVDALVKAPVGRGDPPGETRAAELRDRVRAAARGSARWRSVGELAARQRADTVMLATGGGVGALGGTLVHRVMQELDLGGERATQLLDASVLVKAIARELGVEDDLARRCDDVVKRVLAHPVFDDAREAPEHWKEVPFAFEQRGTIIAGVIDLCFPTDATRKAWVVVEWKSDLPESGPVRAGYEKQVAIYAQAVLKTVTSCERVVKTALVGPYRELPTETEAERALANVSTVLRPLLVRLLDAGAPVPAVGLDVGDPIVATLELAWPDRKVGVSLDLASNEVAALRAAGWDVLPSQFAAHDLAAIWLSLSAALGVVAADALDDGGDGRHAGVPA